ncbi:MAG: hypothetical protein J5772_04400 [Clostridia bacterium]|nr:hypothetical protein [Clostridia bacterium]
MKGIGMKKAIAAILLLALLAGLTACGRRTETGDLLSTNIARVYMKDERSSCFVKDGERIEGEVRGKAYIDIAADGNTALAWVDSIVYFVSEQGIDMLGSGIDAAEISFDGRIALFMLGDKLMRFSAESRASFAIAEGVYDIVQTAISPNSESIVFTAVFEGEGASMRSMLFREGELTPVLTDGSDIVLAVSDDASTIYYFDSAEQALCVQHNGEKTVISTECGAASSYNFTRDLSEVAYFTEGRKTVVWRLSDGLTADLGTGFGYTLKTEVYSMSKLTLPTYINGTGSFLNGLWARRDRADSGDYLFSIAYIDEKGEVDWIVLGADEGYKVSSDAKRVIWQEYDKIYMTDLSGKTTTLAGDAVSFTAEGDCKTVYYISLAGSLFEVKRAGEPKKLDTGVSRIEAMGGGCAYIKDRAEGETGSGTLCFAKDGKTQEIMGGAVRFEKRSGQLIVYTDPVISGEDVLYTVRFTVNGTDLELIADGVEP